jgi:hypothetical protein
VPWSGSWTVRFAAVVVARNADRRDLTRSYDFQRFHERPNERQQIFNAIGSGANDKDRKITPAGSLLTGYTLIDGQQDIVAGEFSGTQELPILQTFQPVPLNRSHGVPWKAVPKIDRQALTKQNLQAILAKRESLASSSASTAI